MSQSPDGRPCPGCGAVLGDSDRFCWKCGAGMRQSFPAPPRNAAQPVVSSAVLVVIAVLLALIGSAMTCGMGANGPAALGVLLGLAAAGLCVYAGWQMAGRR